MKKIKLTHSELVTKLKEIVRSKKAGERLKNDRDLAESFGISNVTLRAAMLELHKEGLVTRRVGAGTFVADVTSRQHVAVVVPQMLLHAHRMPYGQTMCMSILDELNHQSINHKLYVVPRVIGGKLVRPWPQAEHVESSGLASAIASDAIRGVIMIAIGLKSGWAHTLVERGVPIIGGQRDGSLKYVFSTDYEQSLRKAVRYLVAHGRRRIGFLSWLEADHRKAGPDPAVEIFKDEIQKAGVKTRPHWMCNDANPMNPASGWEAFREIWSAYSDCKPDALISKDDRLFMSASSAILEAGIKVPRDLQVVTHWNRNSGIFCPFPIARYQFDPMALGVEVSQVMARILNQPELPPQHIVQKASWFDEGDYESANEYSERQDSIPSFSLDLHSNS